MRRVRCSPACGFLFLTCVPIASMASSASVSDSAGCAESLAQVPALLRQAQYDEAIDLLNTVDAGCSAPDVRARTCLLLARTYVIAGNYFGFRPQGRETATLFHQKAEDVLRECFRSEELRDLALDPNEEYPEPMRSIFENVVENSFGSFRILELQPAAAAVSLDGRPFSTSRHSPSDRLTVGRHQVVVEAPGYHRLEEEIEISPGARLERVYELHKRTGLRGWVSRGGIVAAALAGTWLLFDSTKGDDEPTTLPGPPPPPE